jgi:hypothetical protein
MVASIPLGSGSSSKVHGACRIAMPQESREFDD